MGILSGKKALIFGVANDHSIAWGIAQALHREGATLGFSYAGEKLERRVRPLAESLGSTFVEQCDVTKDEDITATVEKTQAALGELDILVHSIAFAGRDDLSGPYYNVSRAGFAYPLHQIFIRFKEFCRLIRMLRCLPQLPLPFNDERRKIREHIKLPLIKPYHFSRCF